MNAKQKTLGGFAALLLIFFGKKKKSNGSSSKNGASSNGSRANGSLPNVPKGNTPPFAPSVAKVEAVTPKPPSEDPDLTPPEPQPPVDASATATEPKVVPTDNPLVAEIVTARILFSPAGSSTISNESYPVLDGVAKILAGHPDLLCRIEGHASTEASAKFNLKLSQKRADAVLKHLAGKGVAEDHMYAKGYGETDPLPGIPSTSDQNRRVEFYIASDLTDLRGSE